VGLQNWGKEFVKWLGDRVEPVVVDDTKADKVKKSLQVRQQHTHGCQLGCIITLGYVQRAPAAPGASWQCIWHAADLCH
jgi:hypothetical protein